MVSLFQLVVVGSSAGGIEVLSTLVATLPADFTAPVVIAQHLDPALPAQNAQLRLWSAGCATGEEAYSLAILLCEELGDDLERVGVKIFAADVDADAVTFARHGVYPAAALATLPPDLVARYFVRSSDSYIKPCLIVCKGFFSEGLRPSKPPRFAHELSG